MEAFYTCINIAAVFEDTFLKEFDTVFSSYNFNKWEGTKDWVGDELNFQSLMKSWLELGSTSIKMLSSACSYKLKAEKKKTLWLHSGRRICQRKWF